MESMAISPRYATDYFNFHEIEQAANMLLEEAEMRTKLSGSNFQNNTGVTISNAQLDCYSPGEDKMYINEKDFLYAIFDGHGGDMCSKYMAERLPKQLLTTLKSFPNPEHIDYSGILRSTFMKVDASFLNEHKSVLKTCSTGSCGVSVLLRNDTLYIANLGDSRVLLGQQEGGQKWSHTLLTSDHNTKNEKECELVRKRTTDPQPLRNVGTGVDRVGGVLMVTRSFGNGLFKRRDMSLPPFIHHLPYIISEPEITVHKLTPEDRYLVISSDGLYEYLTPADVAQFMEKQLEDNPSSQDLSKVAIKLVERQFEVVAAMTGKKAEDLKKLSNKKTFMDDTTVIVLYFHNYNQNQCT